MQAPSLADCLACRRVLEKFCIGSLAAGELVVAYTEDLEEGQFFAVLKKRVEKYFRGNQARAAPPQTRSSAFGALQRQHGPVLQQIQLRRSGGSHRMCESQLHFPLLQRLSTQCCAVM